jgi:hypothetical protein
MTDSEGGHATALPVPLGFADFVGASWSLFRTNFITLFFLFAPLLVVVNLLGLIYSLVRPGGVDVLDVTVTIAVNYVLPPFVGSLLLAASHVVMIDRCLGKGLTTGTSMSTLRAVRPGLLQSALLSVVLVMFGTLLLGFPLLLSFLWGPPIIVTMIVVEGGGQREAFPVMRDRLSGKWLLTLGLLLFAGVAVFVVQLFASVLLAALTPGGAGAIVRGVVGPLVAGSVLPFLAAATLVLYFMTRADGDLAGRISSERDAMLARG